MGGWLNAGDVVSTFWKLGLAAVGVGLILAVQAAPSLFEQSTTQEPRGEVDRLLFARLDAMGIKPAAPCSDAVFVRRIYLDLIGTLPTAKEALDFLRDEGSDKRSALIGRLLDREEYADYWAMKWCDLLRVKAEFPINLWPNAVQAYHRWIRTAVRDNLSYDQFARGLLTASGSNFRVPQVNFYRAVPGHEAETIAQAVALTFMGERAERWPEGRLEGLEGFFSQVGFKGTAEWKEEIVFHDVALEAGVDRVPAVFPDGTEARLRAGQDPRGVFADWLTRADNPWFARNLVNRMWFWLLGRGIIHEPDDGGPDNPPSNPELLAWLEKSFVESGYDLQTLQRQILNSQVYQLSSVPRSSHPDARSQFAAYPVRRLEAEVLIDALCQITGTTEEYTSEIPEPFTFIPEDQRSIQLADGSISSSFLEMFGRPSRDTGLTSERNNRPTASQRLHLLNSSHVQRKIEQSRKLRSMIQSRRPARAKVAEVYLTILSRRPVADEFVVLQEYAETDGVQQREVMVDLVWALINSPEFLYRH